MKSKKIIVIPIIILFITISVVALWCRISSLRAIYPLQSRMSHACQPEGEGFSFNKNGDLKYTDLSLKLRKTITKEQFESIENYLDAQLLFNAASAKVKKIPLDSYVVDQPILRGRIWIDDKAHLVYQEPVIGYERFIKPVIIHWHMDIEPD